MNSQKDNLNGFEINVKISDIILTPFACASIINEILKGLLYQKCQIPYPYNWLKNVVTKKRQKTESEIKPPTNFKAESHFRLVSNALDTLETAMSSITNELSNNGRNLTKVVIVLGTTPYTASEVFTIVIPSLAKGHNERNHVAQLNKYKPKILRCIFLSQDWLENIDASISCTNIYLYLVKCGIDHAENPVHDSSEFLPTSPLSFATKTKKNTISLNLENQQDTNCCDNLEVFQDVSDITDMRENIACKEHIENNQWYKYKNLVKGFKDCFVDKKSISELW